MTTEQKRQALIKAYPRSKSWRAKVIAMSDNQVIATYLSFQARGKFN